MDTCVDAMATENPDLLASWTEDDDEEDEEEETENTNDIWQHLVALLIAGLAAVVAHVHLNVGYIAWRGALSEDWDLLKAKLTNSEPAFESHAPTFYNGNLAPAAQPSFDLIPLEERTKALDRAFGRVRSDHERARAFRRTRELKFCPNNGLPVRDIDGQQNLMEMEFILQLEPR